jgi:hypothetical protein
LAPRHEKNSFIHFDARFPSVFLHFNHSLLQVDLYTQVDNIMYGNKTVAVYKNSVKFSTAVTNWEFNAAANQIRYSIFMGSPGRPGFYD